MLFLPHLRSSTDTFTLPHYTLLNSHSHPSYISTRFWTAARISILCSFLVVAAFVWNCGSQLVPEQLQQLQGTSGSAWFAPPTNDNINNAPNTTNVVFNVTLPPLKTLLPEGVMETATSPVKPAPVVHLEPLDTVEFKPYEEQIDIVYTWVNGSDPDHLALKKKLGSFDQETRYDYNLNELRYSLRSVEHHLQWFTGNIYIVTPGQTPNWLNTSNPRIKIINQDDILPKEAIPTCNAFFLEFYLDRIPGLSEKFIYLNDDYFILKDATPDDFFTDDGRVKSFPNSPARFATIGDFYSHEARLNKTAHILGTNREHDNIWQTSMSWTILKVREILDVQTVSFFHLPFVWERSVMEQVRIDFNESLTAMYQHKFRHWRDLQAPSVIYSEYLAFSHDEYPEGGRLSFDPVDPAFTRRFALFGGCGDRAAEVETFERYASWGRYKFGNMNSDFENPESAGICRRVLSRMFPGASQYELADVSEGLELLGEPVAVEGKSDADPVPSSSSFVEALPPARVDVRPTAAPTYYAAIASAAAAAAAHAVASPTPSPSKLDFDQAEAAARKFPGAGVYATA